MKKILAFFTFVLLFNQSMFTAHLPESNHFVPVKTSRSWMGRVCSGAGSSTDAVRQDAYKVNKMSPSGRKIHIEHKEVSEIIDIDLLDLNLPVVQNPKSHDDARAANVSVDDASTAMVSTDRSLNSQGALSLKLSEKNKSEIVKTPSRWQNFKSIFSRPDDINVPNRKGVRPLEQAIRDSNLKEVVKLVRDGANPNLQDRSGNNALHIVLESAHYYPYPEYGAMLEFLIESGADINVQNNKGETSLHQACQNLQQEFIDILIDHKANLNLQDAQGKTPLMAVINRPMPVSGENLVQLRQAQANIVQDLIRAGADISIKDSKGRLPFDDAIYLVKQQGMLSSVADTLALRQATLNKKAELSFL